MKAGAKKSKWQLQEAKNAFSEVVNRALTEGAQTITRHGKDVVVVLSQEEFRKLAPPKKRKKTLLEVLRSWPEPMAIERVNDKPRDINL